MDNKKSNVPTPTASTNSESDSTRTDPERTNLERCGVNWRELSTQTGKYLNPQFSETATIGQKASEH